jgi:hypothetical protein
LKLEYEKPTAVPLGEAAKGSGQCNAGSGVGVGVGYTVCSNGTHPGTYGSCEQGFGATWGCGPGGTADKTCAAGTTTSNICQGGSIPSGGQ